jgi:hypothetical protein
MKRNMNKPFGVCLQPVLLTPIQQKWESKEKVGRKQGIETGIFRQRKPVVLRLQAQTNKNERFNWKENWNDQCLHP